MPTLPLLNPNEERVEIFLTELMKINSCTGNEEDLSAALTVYFKATGWHVLQQPLKSDPKRHNLLVTKTPYIAPGPRYVLNTHMDTVPPYIAPAYDGTKITGRGANDAKGWDMF
ncbi:unnamed protein product [Brugia timori]|uniref:M20_dimer domain-containing protein n=1 Tax=Brugia timori TaxID=42155 RepID=A0A0R3Q937_9BILA|nr:unnamed protein product [Brugia timori]